jgi:hypothetical protein
MNHGNTGQRYHLRKIVGVEARENKVIHFLECGHSSVGTWDSPEQAQRVADRAQGILGSRTRCNKCEVPA